MVIVCLDVGCPNRRYEGVFFYGLPFRDEKLMKRWLVNLRIDTIPQFPENQVLCAKHFEPECFVRDLRAELLGEKRKPPLKKDAVPTLFAYNNFKANVKKRVLSEERRKRKEKQEILKDLLGPYHEMKLIPPDLITEVNEDEYTDEYSIRSLLPNFSLALENDIRTSNEKVIMSHNEPSVGHGVNHRTSSDDSPNTKNDERSITHGVNPRTRIDGSPNISRDKPSIDQEVNHQTHSDDSPNISHDKPSISHGVSHRKCTDVSPIISYDNPSISLNHRTHSDDSPNTTHKKPSISDGEKHGRTSEISCQTVEKPTTEISCQTSKPCLVTVETQWDEKDFLPDPELVARDHAYCKRKCNSDSSCQVDRVLRSKKTKVERKLFW